MVEIKKLIERDSQGTPRQVFPETHIEAILGLKEQLNDTEVDNGTLAAILADANKFRTDIDTLDAVKADKTFVDAQLAQTESQLEFQANADIPIVIPTYDGNNQTTHPKVLYFETPWIGY